MVLLQHEAFYHGVLYQNAVVLQMIQVLVFPSHQYHKMLKKYIYIFR